MTGGAVKNAAKIISDRLLLVIEEPNILYLLDQACAGDAGVCISL